MIEYTYLVDFQLDDESKYTNWIIKGIEYSGLQCGSLTYVFTGDEELWRLNQKFLKHDTYTDILTFDYSSEAEILGEIVISIDRVKDNASEYKIDFDIELKRVMAHGILHLLGYRDGTKSEKAQMREMEDKWIKMFHVEQW